MDRLVDELATSIVVGAYAVLGMAIGVMFPTWKSVVACTAGMLVAVGYRAFVLWSATR